MSYTAPKCNIWHFLEGIKNTVYLRVVCLCSLKNTAQKQKKSVPKPSDTDLSVKLQNTYLATSPPHELPAPAVHP